MNNELTPLEALKQFRNSQYQGVNVYADELLDIIETALRRLEEIDNKPVAFVVSNRDMEDAIIEEISKHKEIKITNLADQKKLKALEIIEKYFWLDDFQDFVSLNGRLYKKSHKEEYELLKEMLKNE